MNKFSKRLLDKASDSDVSIVLPERNNRTKEAKKTLQSLGINIAEVEDYTHKEEEYVNFLSRKRFTSNWNVDSILEYLNDPVVFGATMVAVGDAGGMVAGSANDTSHIIRTSIRVVGIDKDSQWVSSIFFLVSPDGERSFTFSDCGVIPEPTSEQLTEIAKDAASFHQTLSGEEPRVAFLSFSTKGSASHYRVDRVIEAVKMFNMRYSHIANDGELQFDAAIDTNISKKKAPNSSINGSGNVLIFPNLDAGNIAYKIMERMAGYSAWGPLLQGLKKPVHDLSRGCSSEDIVNVGIVTAAQC